MKNQNVNKKCQFTKITILIFLTSLLLIILSSAYVCTFYIATVTIPLAYILSMKLFKYSTFILFVL